MNIGFLGLLIALCVIALRAGARDAIPADANSGAMISWAPLLVLPLVFGAGIGLWKWHCFEARERWRKALQDPGPEKLVEMIVRTMRAARAQPDADAFEAQAKAIAYSLYGRGNDATNALAGVNWGVKGPLVQTVGLSAEGIVELLCRRDAWRAFELNGKARTLASVSDAFPDATQSEMYLGTCVAVSEALLNAESELGLNWLRDAAADGSIPPLQVLASFGLAIALEHLGDAERSGQLRRFLLQTAPYCCPLHANPTDFLATGPGSAESQPGPVSSSIASANGGPFAHVQERNV